jgi:hypothetical protein
MSDITDDEPSNRHLSNDVITSNDTDCSTNTSAVQMKRGDCPKGTTKQAAAETHKKMKESITKAALLYEKATEEARKERKQAISKGIIGKLLVM